MSLVIQLGKSACVSVITVRGILLIDLRFHRYPPETEEQKTKLYAWFGTRTPQISVEKTPKILEDIEGMYGKKTWGAVGVIYLLSSSPWASSDPPHHLTHYTLLSREFTDK